MHYRDNLPYILFSTNDGVTGLQHDTIINIPRDYLLNLGKILSALSQKYEKYAIFKVKRYVKIFNSCKVKAYERLLRRHWNERIVEFNMVNKMALIG